MNSDQLLAYVGSSNFKLQCACHKNEASKSILGLDWNTLEQQQKKTQQTNKQKAPLFLKPKRKKEKSKQDFQSTYNFFFFLEVV